LVERNIDDKLSRRQFVGTAAAGAAVLGAGALLTPKLVGATASAKLAAPQSASLVAPAEAAVPTKWDATYGVIVVGTGHPGLAAAVAAFDSGSTSVTVIEKEAYLGGTSQFAGGNYETPLNFISAAAGVQDTFGLCMSDYLIAGQYRNNPALLASWIRNANDSALWLQNLGIVWNPVPALQSDESVARTMNVQQSPNYPMTGSTPAMMTGSATIYVMAQALAKRSVSIQCGKRLTQIYRVSGGPVVGIQVLDVPTGTYSNWQATKAVVLATGNATGNPQMMASVDPQLDEVYQQMGQPYVHKTGDGHICAAEVGAGFVDMEYTSLGFVYGRTRNVGPMAVMLTPQNLTAALSTYHQAGTISGGGGAPGAWGILVAGDGNRFVNEGIWATTTIPAIMSANYQAYFQIPFRPRNAWVIVDSNGAKALSSSWSAANIQAASTSDVAPYLESSMVAYSTTIAGLATQMQIPATALQATIDRWNGFVTAGKDSDFGRPAPLNPISTPPYFASKLQLEASQVAGGIRVNTKQQVIDCQAGLMASGSSAAVALDNEPVIPGLYAAGECAGGFFGTNRADGKIGCYLTQGRIAGINAGQQPSNV